MGVLLCVARVMHAATSCFFFTDSGVGRDGLVSRSVG